MTKRPSDLDLTNATDAVVHAAMHLADVKNRREKFPAIISVNPPIGWDWIAMDRYLHKQGYSLYETSGAVAGVEWDCDECGHVGLSTRMYGVDGPQPNKPPNIYIAICFECGYYTEYDALAVTS